MDPEDRDEPTGSSSPEEERQARQREFSGASRRELAWRCHSCSPYLRSRPPAGVDPARPPGTGIIRDSGSHNDHSDHTDTSHNDSSHGDSTHTDSSHTDGGHTDHSDSGKTHGDTGTVHTDSGIHGDGGTVRHYDTGRANIGHQDQTVKRHNPDGTVTVTHLDHTDIQAKQ